MGFQHQATAGEIIYGGMNAQGQRLYDLYAEWRKTSGLTETMLERVRTAIREAFHASLLMLVDRQCMTATEVIQREQEKMRLLGLIWDGLLLNFMRPIDGYCFRYHGKEMAGSGATRCPGNSIQT